MWGSRRFDAAALWRLPRVGGPVVSPDGGRAAFTVERHDDAAGHRTRALAVVDVAGGPVLALTDGPVVDGRPTWSPDGGHLAFTRRAAGQGSDPAALCRIDVASGEVTELAALPVSLAEPVWSPDGGSVLCRTAPAPAVVADGGWEAVAEALEARKADPVTARATEDRMYRFWDRWLVPDDFPQLVEIPAAPDGGGPILLTPGWRRHFDLWTGEAKLALSPCGRRLVFRAHTTPAPYQGHFRYGLFCVEREAGGGWGAPTEITRGEPAGWAGARWSPDGETLAVGWQLDLTHYADHVRLGLWSPRGGLVQRLATGWDRSAAEWAWRADGSGLVVAAEDGHAKAVFEVGLDGSLPRRLTNAGSHQHLAPAPDGSLLLVAHSLCAPPEIARLDPGAAEPVRLTSEAADAVAAYDLATVEESTVTGADGDDVPMLVLTPAGPAPTRGHGLLCLLHGGPHGQFGDAWHWRWNVQVFSAMGYLCAAVNFHGSTGRGDAYTRSILGDHRTRPFADVMAATDALIAAGQVDDTRMAVAGGSYGGYLTTWVTSQTDRFHAAINHAGVVSLEAMYGSDITTGRAEALGGVPWVDAAHLDGQTPIRAIGQVSTPTLVIHGERDYRVPVDQALAYYGMLKARGVPARLVVYPDENHWILKRDNSVRWYAEVERWLERWLSPPS